MRIHSIAGSILLSGLLLAGALGGRPAAAKSGKDLTVRVRTTSGEELEGTLHTRSFSLLTDGKTREVEFGDLLSVRSAAPASSSETEEITKGLAVYAGTDRKAIEAADAELCEIGMPVVTPLLDTYKDTDLHQPNPLYRLFERVMPGYADAVDRNQDLVRLADGSAARGKIQPESLSITVGASERSLPLASVRTLAVRRATIEKTFAVRALQDCTQIEFLDAGVAVSSKSKVEENCEGLVRLSFAIDGWASDPDGLKVPGPHYTTTLVDGLPFGALVGRIGAAGPRWLAGKHFSKSGLGTGRLYFAVNDNPHWQNNIGSFRVRLRVTDAYDLGDPS